VQRGVILGKTLIIAEKPSQAREYAKALGVKGKGEGFFENEEYIISWCVGHLFELKPPETYMELARVGKRWGLHRLPVLPPLGKFQYGLKTGTQKQFKVLAKLLKSPEVHQVICGTDADREGQLLFQEVWDQVGCQKPLWRLWISSLTKEAIQEGMSNLRPAHEVAGLVRAGYGRAYSDWDFGMNLTEGFTALFGSFDPVRKKPNVISIGRVQTPTLALVVEREWAIQNFVSQTYYEVEAEFAGAQGTYKGKWFRQTAKKTDVEGSKDLEKGKGKDKHNNSEGEGENSKHSLTKEQAQEIIAKVQGKPGRVKSVKEKETLEYHPLLFDLTSLTVAASKRYGFGAEKVLKLAQSLYEKKAITYPRTDCNYLPPDILPKLKAHLQALNQGPFASLVQEALARPLPKSKRVINEITAHHAIIPTTEKLSQKLSADEEKLWEMIVLRFLSIWFPPARYEEKEIITQVEDEYFLTKGKILLDPGWKKVEKEVEKETEKGTKLPLVKPEEQVQNLACKALEKETKPPKRYTQGDLIKAMEGAGKEIEDETLRQQLKGKGIGTVATRPAIIENLLGRGYLVQQQRFLVPTDKGMELIRLIKTKLPKAQLLISAEMTGQMEYELAQVEKGHLSLEQFMAKVEQAICDILEELRQYEAMNGKTPLALAPVKGRGTAIKKGIDLEQEDNSDQTPGKQATGAEVLGKCPNCGGKVVVGPKSYSCENRRQGCQFALWKTPICGKVLTPAQVKSLLKKGKTNLIKGFRSQKGKSFAAYLVWEEAAKGKLKFEFPQMPRS